MNFFDLVRQVFRMKTDIELAHTELADARRELLAAATAVDYATAVTEYNRARIERLITYIKANGGTAQ